MLAAATTPAFAAKSNVEQTKPPTLVDPSSTKPKTEQVSRRPAVSAGSGTPGVPAGSVVPGAGAGAELPSGSIVAVGSAGSAYQPGSGSSSSAGNTGSSYSYGTGNSTSNSSSSQYGADPFTSTGNSGSSSSQASTSATGSTGSAYPQESTSVAGPGTTGAAYPAGPRPLFELGEPGTRSKVDPDVRVVFVNSASNSTSTLYHFRVENVGPDTATAINLSSMVREQSNASTANRRVDEQYAPIVSLSAGQTQDVVVTCTPRAGYRCVSGALEAYVANDLSPANNGANSYRSGEL